MIQRYEQLSIRRTIDAVIEPVTLAEAKSWLRVDNTVDDSIITMLIPAARQLCEGFAHIAFLEQTWLQKCRLFGGVSVGISTPATVRLERKPVLAVLSVGITNNSGSTTVIPSTNYNLNDNNLVLTNISPVVDAYTLDVEFTAGVPAVNNLAAGLKIATLVAIGYLYERRGDDQGKESLPDQAKEILTKFKAPIF